MLKVVPYLIGIYVLGLVQSKILGKNEKKEFRVSFNKNVNYKNVIGNNNMGKGRFF